VSLIVQMATDGSCSEQGYTEIVAAVRFAMAV
jgi:hypothetical protein